MHRKILSVHTHREFPSLYRSLYTEYQYLYLCINHNRCFFLLIPRYGNRKVKRKKEHLGNIQKQHYPNATLRLPSGKLYDHRQPAKQKLVELYFYSYCVCTSSLSRYPSVNPPKPKLFFSQSLLNICKLHHLIFYFFFCEEFCIVGIEFSKSVTFRISILKVLIIV